MNPIAWILSGAAWNDLRKPVSFLAFCLVLFGIPLTLLWGLHREMLGSRRLKLIEQRRNELEQRIGKNRLSTPGIRSFNPDLIVLWRAVWRSSHPGEAFIAFRKRLKRAFSGLIDIVLIDSQGKQVPSVSDPVLSNDLLQMLLGDALLLSCKSVDLPP